MSSKKKFQKLRLRKQSEDYKGSCEPSKATNELEELKLTQNSNDDKLPAHFYESNFDTPPFVTKSRPKYNKTSYDNISDFIDDSLEIESTDVHKSHKSKDETSKVDIYYKNIVRNRSFDSSRDSFNEASPALISNNSIEKDVLYKASTTPQNVKIPLSPQSARIMTSVYGNVWMKTPGLFDKREYNKNDKLEEVINQLDMLTSFVETLTGTKKHEYKKNRHKKNGGDLKELKPKMLSFENDNNLDELNDIRKTNSYKLDFENDSSAYPDLNRSNDSIYSIKRVVKKKVLASSSSGNSDSDNTEAEGLKIRSESEKEHEESENEIKIQKKMKLFRKSHLVVENDLECSVVIIETDDDNNLEKKNSTVKKSRKLFNKHNIKYEDVEFISETLPDFNRQFELVSRSIENIHVVKHTDREQFDILTEQIEKISLIDNDNIFVKDIKKKQKNPIEKKITKKIKTKDKKKPIENSRNKENVAPLSIQSINLDNLEVYSFMGSLADGIPSWRCDKEAKYYKDKFRSKKSELTQKLFKMFNENVFEGQLDSNLPIIWSSTLQTTAGRACNKIKKSKTSAGNVRSSTVELSVKVLDGPQRLRNTLAHELCHVAAWMIDGQLRDGHGPYWKKWVAKVLTVYPELGSIPTCHSYSIHFKYTFKCVRCGYGVNRQSKSIDVNKKACGYCGGRFECIHNKKNKDGLVVSTPVKRTSRELKGFALYVKENYGNVRGSNTPHKQAMQYLGKQYAKMKATQSSDSEQGKI